MDRLEMGIEYKFFFRKIKSTILKLSGQNIFIKKIQSFSQILTIQPIYLYSQINPF